MNWVEDVVEQHKEFESPLSFWRWAAIAAMSAVLKDNVWMDRGSLYNLYPNIYVMFHASSGLKKGPPVAMASRIAKEAGAKVIKGRSSIQAILKEMGTNNSYTIPGGKVVREKSTAFICSSELTSSIVEDKVATDILVDLYDRQYNVDIWRSLLKMETFDLRDPTISMLTATNEGHSENFFSRKDITGGYYARTFIVHEKVRNRINSLLIAPERPVDYKITAEYLKVLSKLRGQFKGLASRVKDDVYKYEWKNPETNIINYYNESGIIYEPWYQKFSEAIVEIQDPTGTLNRFGDSVLKVAMLLSLARYPDLNFDPEAMNEAIALCEKLIGDMRTVTLKSVKTDDATNAVRKAIIIQELMERDNHSITRKQLLKKYWVQGNANEWDDCVTSFEQAGLVKLETIGPNVIIKMSDVDYEQMKRFLQGRLK